MPFGAPAAAADGGRRHQVCKSCAHWHIWPGPGGVDRYRRAWGQEQAHANEAAGDPVGLQSAQGHQRQPSAAQHGWHGLEQHELGQHQQQHHYHHHHHHWRGLRFGQVPATAPSGSQAFVQDHAVLLPQEQILPEHTYHEAERTSSAPSSPSYQQVRLVVIEEFVFLIGFLSPGKGWVFWE